MADNEKKKSSYISGKESRRITRFNRRVTKKLEKERHDANKDPALYTTTMKDENNVVEFDNVCTYFFSDVGVVKAVDGVTFNVPKCSTVGVVGESGCGKSVTSLSLMQLLPRPAGQTVGGQIRFNLGDGKAYNIVNTPNSIMETIRGNRISMIFQEPMTALNPVFKIGQQVNEVTELHHPEMTEEQVKQRTLEMLELVGIANKEGVYNMYPHELSGGMRQRICIAIALACDPALIIADEPTTALDVTIQAQILELMQSLQKKLGMAVILVTHDLGVIADLCDNIVVMYGGRICERGTAHEIFYNPRHEYTKGLLRSIPNVNNMKKKLVPISGTPINMLNMPKGCAFCARCDNAMKVCLTEVPEELWINSDHKAACWLNVRDAYREKEAAE